MKPVIIPANPRITPFLWFNQEAERAARFYTSIFGNSKILGIARYSRGSPGKPGSVMTVNFQIGGHEFTALNGGRAFKITPAISFVVHCQSQQEIDYYWRRLSAGGRKVQCGWLEDKFGVSWQIVPDVLFRLIASKDKARAERVTRAMLKMGKLEIRQLQRAAR